MTYQLPEPDPHIKATIAKIPDAELRPLLEKMLMRTIMIEGPSPIYDYFPLIAQNWVEPGQWSPPQ